ncbi:sensor histidine kinase [Sphingobacterium luzhongxinii]|uniref:sensor histidine kinase n=1 Tax=Sphingobacterium luzhongxinii TaxID=2654181 RepID=UPI0013DA0D59|nr:histidine kinase [Sphingobacterium sp. xlx-73]
MNSSYLAKNGLRLFVQFAPAYGLITYLLNRILKPENTVPTVLTGLLLLLLCIVFGVALIQLVVYSYTRWSRLWMLTVCSVAFIAVLLFLLYVLLPNIGFFDYLEVDSTITMTSFAQLVLRYTNALVMAGFIYYHISAQYHHEQMLQAREEAHRQDIRNRELLHQKEVMAKNLEIAFLTAQINPHFLHNTIAALQEECIVDNPLMAEQLANLSDLMRYKLECTDANIATMPHRTELDGLKKYLAIMQWRFPQADIRLSCTGRDNGQQVLPTVLLVLAENMFKHGRFRYGNYPLSIVAELGDATVTYRFRNKIDPQSERRQVEGVGIANIVRRLDLVYPLRYELRSWRDEEECYNVYLQIKQEGHGQ